MSTLIGTPACVTLLRPWRNPCPCSRRPPWAHAQLSELRRARSSVSVHAASRGEGGGDRCSSEPTGIQSREGPGVSWGGGCESLQSSLSHRGVRQRTVTSLVVGWGEGGEGRQQGPHVGSPKSGGPNRCTITCSAQAVTPQVTRYCHVPCRPRLLSYSLSPICQHEVEALESAP